MGELFRVSALVGATSSTPVDAVQVYVEFDSEVFQVVSIDAGPSLEFQLQSLVDNDAGRVGYAAGTLEGELPYSFTLCTLTVRPLKATSSQGSHIEFAPLEKPRQTKAVHRGLNVTGRLVSIRVTVR